MKDIGTISLALKSEKKKDKIGCGIKAIIALVLFAYFWMNQSIYMHHGDLLKKRILFVCILFVIAITLSIFRVTLAETVDRIISVLMMIGAPLVAWFMSEEIINTPICNFEPTAIWNKELLWNMIAIGAVLFLYLLLLSITNRITFAGTFLILALVIFSTVICIVYELRGTPMLAPDVLTAGTAASVLGQYTIHLNFEEYLGIFAAVLFCFVCLQLQTKKMSKKLPIRGAIIVLSLAASVVFTQKVVLSDYMSQNHINIRMFRPMESYQKYGSVTTFLRSVDYAIADKPEGYSVEKVKKIMKKYETTTKTSEKQPNIITVINETYSDIKVLGDFETNEDYMPVYHSLKENTVKGYTYASIVGGQTANTEFEFLTGNTLGFFSPGIVAFQIYMHGNMPGMPSNLKNIGYQGNIALHPYNPNNYNRPNAYSYLGFSEFLSIEDMPKNAEILRRYVSDDAAMDKVISEYEKAKKSSDDPFFMYTMTIQNHSPYDKDYPGFEQSIKILGDDYDADAQRYLNLIKYSDESLGKMVEYFENVDEPTVLLFVGDHQPRLSDSFLNSITNGKFSSWSSEEMMKRYQVPFVIWANYDIEEKYVEKTSMNYLQNLVLDTAGVQKSGYQNFLSEINKKIPSITLNGYWGDNGKFYRVNDKTSPYYDLIQEYQMIQYNMMFDSSNRVDSFFETSKN